MIQQAAQCLLHIPETGRNQTARHDRRLGLHIFRRQVAKPSDIKAIPVFIQILTKPLKSFPDNFIDPGLVAAQQLKVMRDDNKRIPSFRKTGLQTVYQFGQ